MTIIKLPKKFNEYNPKTLKHLQDVYLMMLKDFIKVCDENQIEYYAYLLSNNGEKYYSTRPDAGSVIFYNGISVYVLENYFCIFTDRAYARVLPTLKSDYYSYQKQKIWPEVLFLSLIILSNIVKLSLLFLIFWFSRVF